MAEPTAPDAPVDSPCTDNRRQIAAALIVDHNTNRANLLPVAVVDFYGDRT